MVQFSLKTPSLEQQKEKVKLPNKKLCNFSGYLMFQLKPAFLERALLIDQSYVPAAIVLIDFYEQV